MSEFVMSFCAAYPKDGRAEMTCIRITMLISSGVEL